MKEDDPIGRFAREYARAQASEPFEAGRCALATANAQGHPSVRFVLLKGFDARGFVFYTNLESQKARDLEENPRAALVFHWHTTGVQVRARGAVGRVSDQEADTYFATRDRESQLGAWVSRQSAELDDRKTLEAEVAKAAERFEGVSIERPPFWGGFRITPDAIEFWENRDGRLHDRWLHTKRGDRWRRVRLYP